MKQKQKKIEIREQEFGKTLIPFLDKYGKQTIRAFFDYWRERNPNGKKMRFEMEKVFDLRRRLTTWESKNEEWRFKNKKDIAPSEIAYHNPLNNIERLTRDERP